MPKNRINFINFEEVEKIDTNTVRYKGYTISKDGWIKNRFNKLLKINPKTGIVRLSLEERFQSVIAGRFIYEMFSRKTLTKGQMIKYKDGNPLNLEYKNLEIMDRKAHFKDFEYVYKISVEEEKEIKKEYKTGKYSYIKLAKKHNCSLSTITKIMNGTYRK